jgi:lipid II:glycine glycyltransferase (peptidoglycan interpeptide bridge formation enzyme)
MELHQSPPYGTYVSSLGWKVLPLSTGHIFLKQFFLFGSIAKLQRIYPLPKVEEIQQVCKHYHVRQIIIEASEQQDPKKFIEWCKHISTFVSLSKTPYIPTKTLRISLKEPEEQMFSSFTEAKRRAIRRAKKNELIIKESKDIQQLITIKSKSAGFLGFITTHGAKELWNAFNPDLATTVLAYTKNQKTLLAGVFLIFWEDIAYYWIAGSTKKGKKLFAPTLLAWEAMRIAKLHGAQWFDFLGVWDERFPKGNTEWKGFTKFKEGFGGKAIYYPTHKHSSESK